MAKIAGHLQNIHRQFTSLKQNCPKKQKTFQKRSQQFMLEKFVQKMDGKKFFLYFSQITPEKTNMRNVIFSLPLLKALGCNIKNIAMDFLKYKHVFFEIFTAKNYLNFVDGCLQNFAKISTELMLNPDISQSQKQSIASMIYYDEVIRQKQGPQGIYQQISNAKVRWFSPHPSICCFEILQLDQPVGLQVRKKRKVVHFEQTKPQQQLQQLRRIGINYPLLQIQNSSDKIQVQIQNGRDKNEINKQNNQFDVNLDNNVNNNINTNSAINENINCNNNKISRSIQDSISQNVNDNINKKQNRNINNNIDDNINVNINVNINDNIQRQDKQLMIDGCVSNEE